jgi:hypothetical protein
MIASAQLRIKPNIPPKFLPHWLPSVPLVDTLFRLDHLAATRPRSPPQPLPISTMIMLGTDVSDLSVDNRSDKEPAIGFGNDLLSDVGLLVDPAERLR